MAHTLSPGLQKVHMEALCPIMSGNVDFKPFQTKFSMVCINFSPELLGGGWVGGRGKGWGVGREEAKAPQVQTRGPELLTDGPDHTTRPKGHHSSQG